MKKIAFYLNNANTCDCSEIMNSNPGLGGSEYLTILIPTLLAETGHFDISLYTNFAGKLPHSLKHMSCNSFEEYARNAKRDNIDFCVVNYTSCKNDVVLAHPEISFIIWCHNFASWKNLDFYARQKNIVRIITVGREQLDLYRDHPAFSKSDYIFNTFSLDEFKCKSSHLIPTSKREHNVVYVGSLIECKGFLYLAKAWKKVLKKVPDATLYVIGKGNLYDENTKLGEWGLADAKFEKQFMPHLLGDDGKILSSVNFLGVLGMAKYEVLGNAKVGVPNPGGLTETFGLTAVEMQAMGCHVTTIKCPGYIDTVACKDNLYKRTGELHKHIIRLLLSEEDVDSIATYSFLFKFSYSNVIHDWIFLFNKLSNDSYTIHSNNESMTYSEYHMKKQKEKFRKLKKRFPILHCIPPLEKLFYKKN